jgi:hypothetical protein
MRRHNWEIVTTRWRGMYNPDGGCELYLAADRSKGYSLAPIAARLDKTADPIIEANWNGLSLPLLPKFESPAAIAAKGEKARKPAPAPRPKGPLNSVQYQTPLGGPQRRPARRMPIEGHSAVGRLLKAVLVGTQRRAGVCKRVESMRCDLDDWVQCEYKKRIIRRGFLRPILS